MKQEREQPQIKIEFGFSTSPNYERAVAIAQKLTGYTTWGEGHKLKHQVTFVPEEVEDFLELALLVREWKSAVFWVDEKGYHDWTPLQYLHCIRDRLKAYDPTTYCEQDNYWGCRQVAYSLAEGEFDENGVFHFDKTRFLSRKKDRLDLLETCPFFDRELVLHRLEALDDIIDPRTSENWDYSMDYSNIIQGVYFVSQPQAREIKFATPDERGEKAWRTQIITIPDEKWVEYAEQGNIPEVDILLEQGWRLVTVILQNEVWYCILQRVV